MSADRSERNHTFREPERDLPLAGHYDVIVCGGGPAGIGAAIAAARTGARTLIIENDGFLGGVWTAGLLSLVLDAGGPGKGTVMSELQQRLVQMNGLRPRLHEHKGYTYDAEIMKVALEQMCMEVGVHIRLYTFAAQVQTSGGRIQAVITESVSGREAYTAEVFVDCTGNGALGFLAGCSYESGHPETGAFQPASITAIVSGVPSGIDVDHPEGTLGVRQLFERSGIGTSYRQPGFFGLPQEGYCSFGFHHAYGVRYDSAADWTEASIQARNELFAAVRQIRELPGWSSLQIAATSSRIGIREGRRIAGIYQVTKEDLQAGSVFEDGICTVYFPVDIHDLDHKAGTGYSNGGIRTKPYQIPLRSLISREILNLGMAGRCASGDFYAHASYRVTGNSVPMGEAIGLAAATAVQMGCTLHEVNGAAVARQMRDGEIQEK
ncbi:MAG: glucose-inhibited division protein [Paenibacillaceae bacterium]|nr:glucose-inhibited division protein [Paenibacillaceae bacterium]